MRTTLVLDDNLVRRAKKRAADRNITLSEVVNEALRDALRERPAPARPFKLITYGGSGERVHHEPEDFKRILAGQDVERFR